MKQTPRGTPPWPWRAARKVLLWAAAVLVSLFAGGRRGEGRAERLGQAVETEAAPDAEEARGRAQRYVGWFNERAKATTKTTLVWAAALAVIWLTGLEGARRDVRERVAAIRQNNSEKLSLENRVNQHHRAHRMEDIEIAAEELRIREAEGLRGKKDELKQAALSEDYDTMDALDAEIKEIEEHIEEDLKAMPYLATKDGMDTAKRRKQLDARRAGQAERRRIFEDERKPIEARREQMQRELEKLKSQRRGVSFDIFGQKFDVPPVYAPLIWSLFTAGLIFYLARARATLTALCVRALCASRAAAGPRVAATADIIGDAPWWLAPLPPYQYGEPSTQQGGVDAARVSASEMCGAFGWQPTYHRFASVLSTACLFVALVAQTRVLALSIELNELLGGGFLRAFVPALVVALVALTVYAVWLWFSPVHVPEPLRAAFRGTVSRQLVFWAVACTVVVLLAVWPWLSTRVCAWVGALLCELLSPPAGWSAGRVLKTALYYSPLYLGPALLVYYVAEWYRLKPRADATRRGRGWGRRQFLSAAAGVVGASALTAALYLKSRRQRRAGNPHSVKRWRVHGGATVPLEHGFYLNGRSNVLHYVSEQRRVVGVGASEKRFRVDKLTRFRELPLPVRRRSGGNYWRYVPEQPTDEVSPAEPTPTATPQGRPGAAQERGASGAAAVAAATPESKSAPAAAPDAGEESGREEAKKAGSPSPLSTGSLTPSNSGGARGLPHVNLEHSSRVFETAALFILGGKNLQVEDYEQALRLLTYAINHDIILKPVSGGLPSFRLYDLLAGLTVRYQRYDDFKELKRLIESFGQEGLFRSRLERWQNPGGRWYKRWSNRRVPVRWAGVKIA